MKLRLIERVMLLRWIVFILFVLFHPTDSFAVCITESAGSPVWCSTETEATAAINNFCDQVVANWPTGMCSPIADENETYGMGQIVIARECYIGDPLCSLTDLGYNGYSAFVLFGCLPETQSYLHMLSYLWNFAVGQPCPVCTDGDIQSCFTSHGFQGTQTCTNGYWDVCQCTDPCCGSTDPCCGSTNPCCGSADPCCGSTDPCCFSTDPCCGSTDLCCADPLCCGDPDCLCCADPDSCPNQ
jgi:hypothetical protein